MKSKYPIDSAGNEKLVVSVWRLVEVVKPMSTKFKQGQQAWMKMTSKRGDFVLENLENTDRQLFGFAYKNNIKELI